MKFRNIYSHRCLSVEGEDVLKGEEPVNWPSKIFILRAPPLLQFPVFPPLAHFPSIPLDLLSINPPSANFLQNPISMLICMAKFPADHFSRHPSFP